MASKRKCRQWRQLSLAALLCFYGRGQIVQGRARWAFIIAGNTDTPQLTGFPYKLPLDLVEPSRHFFFNYLKMTSLDPLKSAISIGNVDDTSLALPSFNQCRSGQQRVLEQVQTIKRSKSRHSSSRNGSTSLSPASKNPQGPVQILHTTFVFFLGWFLSF